MASGPQFLGSLSAAADALGNGAIEVNKYESEIVDIVRRSSATLQRIPQVPATGQPHRYFEQTAISTGAFTSTTSISPSATSPTRVERSATIKAVSNQTNFSLFDVDVTRQQGTFAYVEARDIQDIISGIVITEASAIWNGTDTSLTTPTTNQYVGLLTQITQQATIAPGASIIDGIKAQIAAMVANTTYFVMPTAIYVNPILGDYIDREAKAQNITTGTTTVAAGVQAVTIRTQAGDLPIITDPFLPSASGAAYGFGAPPAGNKNYFAVIVTESMLEMPYVGGADMSPYPRLFQLGLLGGLQGQYVGIHFNCIIAKGPSYAHATVAVQRP